MQVIDMSGSRVVYKPPGARTEDDIRIAVVDVLATMYPQTILGSGEKLDDRQQWLCKQLCDALSALKSHSGRSTFASPEAPHMALDQPFGTDAAPAHVLKKKKCFEKSVLTCVCVHTVVYMSNTARCPALCFAHVC
jgi:hypothetical protein